MAPASVDNLFKAGFADNADVGLVQIPVESLRAGCHPPRMRISPDKEARFFIIPALLWFLLSVPRDVRTADTAPVCGIPSSSMLLVVRAPDGKCDTMFGSRQWLRVRVNGQFSYSAAAKLLAKRMKCSVNDLALGYMAVETGSQSHPSVFAVPSGDGFSLGAFRTAKEPHVHVAVARIGKEQSAVPDSIVVDRDDVVLYRLVIDGEKCVLALRSLPISNDREQADRMRADQESFLRDAQSQQNVRPLLLHAADPDASLP